jgi:hypothetical protein
MALLSSFNEDRPVSYIRGYPIYCATLLTVAYGLGILLSALLHQTIDLLGLFAFSSTFRRFSPCSACSSYISPLSKWRSISGGQGF